MEYFDVIVIGAGPAGNSAAKKLADASIETLVIDSRDILGDKLCTGIIGTECSKIFPPEESIVHREALQVTVHSPDGNAYVLEDTFPHALIIDRVKYIQDMADQAIASGATYILDARVKEITLESEFVELLVTVGSEKKYYRAQTIIIATGFSNHLINQVGLSKNTKSDYLIGTQVNVQVRDIKNIQLYTGSNFVKGSFAWLVPTFNSQALFGGIYRDTKNVDIEKTLSQLIDLGIVEDNDYTIENWGIPIKPIPKTFADRVLVIGDAAGFTKPTTGGGIYYSILSGRMAADTIVEAFRHSDFTENILASYESTWKDKFSTELKSGYYARLLYESLGDKVLNILLERFSRKSFQEYLLSQEGFSFDWHSAVILKTLKNREIYSVLKSLGPHATKILSRLVANVLIDRVSR